MQKIMYIWTLIQYVLLLTFCAIFPSSCTHQKIDSNTITSVHRYRIIFEDKIVGHITFEKELLPGIQRSIETLEMRTQFRGLDTIVNRVVEIHEEDMQGRPLRFSKHVDIPNAQRFVLGEIHGSELTIHDKRGDKELVLQRHIPDNFLLHEGLRGKMRIAAQQHKTLALHEWNFDEQRFSVKHLQFIADNTVKNTWRVIQTSDNKSKKMTSEYLADEDLLPLQANFDYFGKHLRMERCEDQCRNDNESALRPLDQQMLPSPYKITDSALKGRIRYQIQMNTSYAPPDTGEQLVHKMETGWAIEVCASCSPLKEADAINSTDYLNANTWLEATDPHLLAAAEKVVKKSDSPAEKMEKLTTFTRKRLIKNPQFSGYATALQAFQSRRGDCTEYALLLAALGRAAQIPTRVLFGLSYSRESFHGRSNVYAPHAWVQAWIDGAWRSYDAALEVFDAGHIALRLSDGNQQDFSGIFENFDQMKIISMQQVVKTSSPAAK